MAINFPDAPTIGDIYSDVTSGISYTWDGTRWAGNLGQPPTSPTYVQTAGDTMTGDLTSPNLTATNIVKAGSHMEGVGQQTILAFTNTEEEVAIPGWANRIELDLAQVTSNSSPVYPFEIRLKAGTGTNYGTVTNNNAITTWTTPAGASSGASAQASYWRIFLPFGGGSLFDDACHWNNSDDRKRVCNKHNWISNGCWS